MSIEKTGLEQEINHGAQTPETRKGRQMKFTISRKDLAEKLSAAAEFTNKKNIVSLPNAVLLKCETDTLTISTFGPDCHYQGRRHVEGGEDGGAFVSYRQLVKFVWAMPDGELDISSDSGKLTVEPVKDKTCQVSIPLLAFEVADAQTVGKDGDTRFFWLVQYGN